MCIVHLHSINMFDLLSNMFTATLLMAIRFQTDLLQPLDIVIELIKWREIYAIEMLEFYRL